MSVQRRDLFYLLYIYIYLEISIYTIYICLTGVLADLRPGDVFLVFLVQFLFTERELECVLGAGFVGRNRRPAFLMYNSKRVEPAEKYVWERA